MPYKYLSLGVVFFLFILTGCTENQPPLSGIPTILIDYIEETEETKIFIRGIDDRLFSNITIRIKDESLEENYTYESHMSTSLEAFLLHVSVWDKQKEYEYKGTIRLFDDDGEMKMYIKKSGDNHEVEKTFPHKIIMERKE
ncbi:MAG: hypothetical protein JSW00_17140 [Thermoplasmata archaeon]|nr:MAG: hypothetical protein JSW00_17140 [Thermoplasmata archaeon]